MSLLGNSVASLFVTLKAVAGGTLQVTRGGNDPVELDFVRGRAATSVLGLDGYITTHDDDFIVRAQEYIDKVGGMPDRFDRFVWTDDNGLAHEYGAKGDGVDRQYDPVDQFGVLIRVHCVEIEAP